MPNVIKRAAALSPGQIRHLLRVTEATSRHPTRDAVILLLGLSVGMRITEVAQITMLSSDEWQIAGQVEQARLSYEKDIYAAEASDRDSARRLAAQQPKDWVRPTVTVVLLVGCLAVVFLMLDGRAVQVMKDPTAAGTLGIVIGYLFNELKTALGFYFGMTKDASTQSQTITQFAVSPGSMTPATPNSTENQG
ncbi:MAG: hypothetical protein VB131_03830 [Burkholderia gladioli]